MARSLHSFNASSVPIFPQTFHFAVDEVQRSRAFGMSPPNDVLTSFDSVAAPLPRKPIFTTIAMRPLAGVGIRLEGGVART
jgi:hypothetical protein